MVIGGHSIKTMANAAPDLRNISKYSSDSEVPILWYCIGGSVANQRDFLIGEVITDLFVSQGVTEAQIIWIPSHEEKNNTNFRTDILEILDGVTKMTEFNIYHKTEYTLGLAKSWLAWGPEYEEINIKVEQLNLALDAAAYYMIKCRTCNLTKFTITNEPTKDCRRMTVETQASFYMDPENYAEEQNPGFKLDERPIRRMREELRKLFKNRHVMPDWTEVTSTNMVKPPVMYISGKRVSLPVPNQAVTPSTKVIFERATRRVEAYKNPGYSSDLPCIPSYDWEKLRIGSINKNPQTTTVLIAPTSAENQFMEVYVSHMDVSRGSFYPTLVIRNRAIWESRSLNSEVVLQVPAHNPVPEVIPEPVEKIKSKLRVEVPSEDQVLEMIEDHLGMSQETRTIADEDNTAMTMLSLSLGEQQSKTPDAKVQPSSPDAKAINKRRRVPSLPREDPLCSDSSMMSDYEFQRNVDLQTVRVNHEVTILKDMMEEDERRREWRQKKRMQVDQRVDESLLFVAQLLEKDAERGGVNKTH